MMGKAVGYAKSALNNVGEWRVLAVLPVAVAASLSVVNLQDANASPHVLVFSFEDVDFNRDIPKSDPNALMSGTFSLEELKKDDFEFRIRIPITAQHDPYIEGVHDQFNPGVGLDIRFSPQAWGNYSIGASVTVADDSSLQPDKGPDNVPNRVYVEGYLAYKLLSLDLGNNNEIDFSVKVGAVGANYGKNKVVGLPLGDWSLVPIVGGTVELNEGWGLEVAGIHNGERGVATISFTKKFEF